MFTDSTEKAAVDKWRETYYEKNLPSTGDDLCQIILQIHNNKYPERIVLEVSASTLMSIKQQYKVSSKRPVPRKRSTMAVDDSIIADFQSLLNEVFVTYRDRNLIINSDLTRIPHDITNCWNSLRTETVGQLKGLTASNKGLRRTKSAVVHNSW